MLRLLKASFRARYSSLLAYVPFIIIILVSLMFAAMEEDGTLWTSCATSLMMTAIMIMASQPALIMKDYSEKTIRYKLLNHSRLTNYFSELVYMLINSFLICVFHFAIFVIIDLIKNGKISIDDSFWPYYGLFLISIVVFSALAVFVGLIFQNPALAPVGVVAPEILGIVPTILIDSGIPWGETLMKIIPFSKVLMYNPADTDLTIYFITSIVWFVIFFIAGIITAKKVNFK